MDRGPISIEKEPRVFSRKMENGQIENAMTMHSAAAVVVAREHSIRDYAAAGHTDRINFRYSCLVKSYS